jgi:hypothetical protein
LKLSRGHHISVQGSWFRVNGSKAGGKDAKALISHNVYNGRKKKSQRLITRGWLTLKIKVMNDLKIFLFGRFARNSLKIELKIFGIIFG